MNVGVSAVPVQYPVQEHQTFLKDEVCGVCQESNPPEEGEFLMSFCGDNRHALHSTCAEVWLKNRERIELIAGRVLEKGPCMVECGKAVAASSSVRYLQGDVYPAPPATAAVEEDDEEVLEPEPERPMRRLSMIEILGTVAVIGLAVTQQVYFHMKGNNSSSHCLSKEREIWVHEAEKTEGFVAGQPLFLELAQGLEKAEAEETEHTIPYKKIYLIVLLT